MESERLRFARFREEDAPALAGLLSDASITRNITANGSTAEKRLATAHKRIAWHNRYWDQFGYGVWALWARESYLAPADQLLGWCGFIPPDGEDPDPEILYAIHESYRGVGLASEAASNAITHLFETTTYQGVTAVISTPLNPGSVKVVSKLGMELRDKMPFTLFLSGSELADDVVDYEIWRMVDGPLEDLDSLVNQVAFRAGQLSTATSVAAGNILDALKTSLSTRLGQMAVDPGRERLGVQLLEAFQNGCDNAYMDCYHLNRNQWAVKE